MKPLFFVFSVVLIVFISACNNPRRDDLEEALSWSYTGDFTYDNWTQINADFGWNRDTFLSMNWMPKPIDNMTGDVIPSEQQKDNFSPYASDLVKYEIGDHTIPSRLGFSYPDIKWEARDKYVRIIKVKDDFEKDEMTRFTEKLNYTAESYRGITIYYCSSDMEKFAEADEIWAAQICGIGYSEADHILLLAPDSSFLKKTIDAHIDKKSMCDDDDVRDIASKIKNAESLAILKTKFEVANLYSSYSMHKDSAALVNAKDEWIKKTFGIPVREIEQLNSPVCICVGEGKNGKSFSILQFSEEEKAEADKEKRLSVLKNGKSIISGRPLKDELFEASAETNGKSLIFYWGTMPSMYTTYDKLSQMDMPWMYSK
jgi:hypothetical protein